MYVSVCSCDDVVTFQAQVMNDVS